MAPTPSLVLIKQAPYRGGVKRFANRYHFDGGFPSGTSPANTLMDAVVNAEKAIYYPYVSIVEALLYPASTNVASFSKTYTTAGTLSGTGGDYTPLENCVLLRYSTTQRSTRNHPIYLFNYFHGAMIILAQTDGLVWSTQKTAVNTYGTAWISGFSDGTNTYHRAGPNGAVAQTRLVNDYIHHHDFRPT